MTNETFELTLDSGNVKEAIASFGSGRVDTPKMLIDDIVVVDGFNVRVQDDAYHAKVREYADSMKANGYYAGKSIAVYIARIDGKSVPVVYDGHRRLAAIKLARSEGADFTTIPVSTAPAGTTMEDLTAALVTHNNGEQLSPMGIAIVCKRFVGWGKDVGQIAKKLNLSRPYVESLLGLAASPAAVRDLVDGGQISATLAIQEVKQHGATKATKRLTEAVMSAKAKGKTRITKKSLDAAPADDDASQNIKLNKKLLGQALSVAHKGGFHDQEGWKDVRRFIEALAGATAAEFDGAEASLQKLV